MAKKTEITGRENGLKSIRDRIKKLAALFAKPRDLVQEIAVDIVIHAKDYNDCSEALTLVKNVPAQMQRSLILYFMAVSPIGVLLRKEGEDKVRFLKPESKTYNDFDIDKARATNWWEMDADRVEREIASIYAGGIFEDIDKMLDRVIEGNDTKTKHYTESAKDAALGLKNVVSQFRADYDKRHPANDRPGVSSETGERAAA